MDALSSWTENNWFNLVQTLGIMGSLWMASVAANRDAKARETENLLTLNGQHHQLWSGVLQKTELQRIFRADANPIAMPATVVEREFLNLVFVHFQTGWLVAKSGALISLAELSADMKEFFSLPLPRAAWEKTKQFRNPRFVQFIEKAFK
jgi:hypothetical protein